MKAELNRLALAAAVNVPQLAAQHDTQ